MKIFLRIAGTFIMFCCLFWTTANAQKHFSPIDEHEVPENVITRVKELHPKPSSINWGLRMQGRTQLFHAHGIENGHPFSVKIEQDGDIIARVFLVQEKQIPEPVLAKIRPLEAEGWKFNRAYQHIHKKYTAFKCFFDDKDNRHLKVEWKQFTADPNNEVKQTKFHIQKGRKHGSHHVIH